MYTYPWYHWITFFYLYCFFGWIFESTYVSLKKWHFVNRGFLRLPMLPLYGTGAVMMLWASLPFQDSILLIYLSGVVAATLLEYVTGYAMERLFKMKYWDYTNLPFNLHGYICLSSSIAWGFLTIFLTEVIHKPIASMVLSLSPQIEFLFIISVSILFLTDSVQSVRAALDLGRALEAMTKMKVELEELQVQLALMKAETTVKVAEIKENAAHRVATVSQYVAEHGERRDELEALLSERLKALAERRQMLFRQTSFYRKGLLRGNPGATSSKFKEALKELKEEIESKYL